MVRPLFASVKELLEPHTLSMLGNVPVKSVRRVPAPQADAYSGSRFYSIETTEMNDKMGSRFILKLPAQDSAPASWDGLNRTVAAWQHGLLDRLPSTIEHAIVGCAHDGAGYAILMQDVGDALVRKRFTVAEHELFLDTMVTMHTAFWEDSRLETSLSPSTYFLIDPTAEGWDFVEDFLEPDVAQVVGSLLQNAQPLYDALAQYPATLVHNDLWYANLGIIRGEPPRVVMLDWDFATPAPPAVELVFYIGENFWVLPSNDEAGIAEAYRSRLARRLGERFDAPLWLPQLELCFLGDFMRRSKWALLEAARAPDKEKRAQSQQRLVRWSAAVRQGAKWL